MKKTILILIVLALMSGLLWSDLHEHYKKGTIKLKNTGDFGKDTDWADYFHTPYNEVIISHDGSIFAVCSRRNCIYKFDKKGGFIKKFGQRGQGPSDMIFPGDPTILDKKYIVVGEYASYKRIDIWDLEGNFVKLIRTKKSNLGTVALKENKIAYMATNQHAEKKNGYKRISQVIIKDINSGKEKVIREITLLDRHSIEVGKHISIGVGNFIGQVILAQTIEGNLAVGVSNQPEIKIYSPKGKEINSFSLKITPIPVSKDFIAKIKNYRLAELEKDGKETMNRTKKFWYEQRMKAIPNFDFSKLFTTHLPLYDEILVDDEGNFLVFKFSECITECKPKFQVYSKTGEFVCETELDTGIYDVFIDTRFKTLRFTTDGIIGYAMEKGDQEEIYKLFKSNY